MSIRFAVTSHAVAALFLVLGVSVPTLSAEEHTIAFENLKRIPDARMDVAYIDPNADFSVYKRVAILEPYVAFRANWQRDQNRTRGMRVSASDMQRIRESAGELLFDTFVEALEANNGFDVVDEVGEDVLVLRPALVDLDVTAPDTRTAGRNRSFSATAGAATLYLEIFDGASGQIIGRAADRRVASRPGHQMTWSNGVTNRSDARRMFRVWADRMREFMDSHYTGK